MPYIAFAGHRRLARGDLPKVTDSLRELVDAGETAPLAVFEEAARALYAWDLHRMDELVGIGPPDLREHLQFILQGEEPA